MNRPEWDTNAIKHWVHLMGAVINSPRTPEYLAKRYKREFYEIKWLVDSVYANTNTYPEEHEWEQERIMNILKNQ